MMKLLTTYICNLNSTQQNVHLIQISNIKKCLYEYFNESNLLLLKSIRLANI